MATKKSNSNQNSSVSSFELNQAHLGDCLDFLSKYNGPKFDLIYLDPPYFLSRDFSLEAKENSISFKGDWKNHEIDKLVQDIAGITNNTSLVKYLSWMYPRLKLMHQHLSDTGSFFLHIGTREGPYLNILLDEIFGMSNWRSTITWQRSHPHNNMKKSLGNVSDFIYYYTKSSKYTFNLLHTPHDEVYLTNSFSNEDERGPYALAPVIQERARKGFFYEYKNITPPNGWRIRIESLKALDEDGRIHWGSNRAYKKVYLDEAKGAALQNIWSDIYNITRTEVDSRKYPTQKPIKLLERIIELTTNSGDLVFDPFSGSGTTLVAGYSLGRKVLGTDISQDAIEITNGRIQKISEQSQNKLF
jgi:site-specific DNA-methyltransferase (adenine-specific)/adenine-specific DNA-methyltransferase